MNPARPASWPKFTRFRGDTARLPFKLTDDRGAVYNPTNSTLIFTCKANAADADSAAKIQKISMVGGIFIIDAAAGTIEVELVPVDYDKLSIDATYQLDVQGQDRDTGEVHTVARATLTVVQDITQGTTLAIPTYTTNPDAVGAGFAGIYNSYAIPATTSNATANGTALLAAYAAAKLLTPAGAALSAMNRACVLVPPGVYDFGAGGELVLDAQYVDLIGLSSNPRNQRLISTQTASGKGTVRQTANDVHIANVHLQIAGVIGGAGSTLSAAYYSTSNLPLAVLRNFKLSVLSGDGGCTRRQIEFSGTYTDFETGDFAFGYGPGSIVSGKFERGIVGDNSLGTGATVSGTFKDIVAGDYSLGDNSEITSTALFFRCRGGAICFGGEGGTLDGKCIECIGGEGSFAGCRIGQNQAGHLNGTCLQCTGGPGSFAGGGGGVIGVNAKLDQCTGAEQSFGGFAGTVSGSLSHCYGGLQSFGGTDDSLNTGVISATAILESCRLTSGSFISPISGAILRDCINANRSLVNVP